MKRKVKFKCLICSDLLLDFLPFVRGGKEEGGRASVVSWFLQAIIGSRDFIQPIQSRLLSKVPFNQKEEGFHSKTPKKTSRDELPEGALMTASY